MKQISIDHDPDANATPCVREALVQARAFARQSTEPIALLLTPGRYMFMREGCAVLPDGFHISNNTHGPKHILFDLTGISNITIDGQGSEFAFFEEMIVGFVNGCRNVTIKNFKMDYAIPTQTQGKIVAVNDATGEIDVKIAEESPFIFRDGKLFITGLSFEYHIHTAGQWDCEALSPCAQCWFGFESVEHVGGNTIRIRSKADWLPDEGNLLVLRRGHQREHPAIVINESKHCELSNITIHHAPAMGVIGQFSEDISIDSVDVIPNKEKGRVHSATADALHFSGCKGQITVENCELAGQMDDSINVHSTYVTITEKHDQFSVTAKFVESMVHGIRIARTGDKIAFIDDGALLPIAEGVVTKAEIKNRDPEHITIVFSRPIPDEVCVGHAIENLTWTPEVVFRNNRCYANRARGALVTTPRKAVIESNYFQPHGAGIFLLCNVRGYPESGPNRDLLIRNNIFDMCCSGDYGGTASAIAIVPVIREFPEGRYFNSNIRIEDNKFYVQNPSLLKARSVDGLTFRRNRIVKTTNADSDPDRPAITLEHCANVSVLDNTVVGDLADIEIQMDGEQIGSSKPQAVAELLT